MSDRKIIFFLICLGNVAITFNIGAVAAAIPLISDDLKQSDLLVAKIVPYYMIPYGFGALLYAPLTRVITYRWILILTMLAYAIFSFISGMSAVLPIILLSQIGAGIAAASSTPLSLMIIGDLFEKDIRGRLVGTYFGTSFFASMVGMISMGTLHRRWLFFIPAMIAGITLLSLVFLRTDLLNRIHEASFNYIKALFRSQIRDVFIFIFFLSFLYHALHKWYGVFLHQEYGLSKEWVSVVLVIVAMCGLMGQQIGGYLSDKKGRLVACNVGLILLAFGAIILGIHLPIIILVSVFAVIAIGWTVSHNSISTILTDFPDQDRPLIASLNSSVRFISGGLGFALSKHFVEKSFHLTFLGIGILMFFALLVVKYFFPKQS